MGKESKRVKHKCIFLNDLKNAVADGEKAKCQGAAESVSPPLRARHRTALGHGPCRMLTPSPAVAALTPLSLPSILQLKATKKVMADYLGHYGVSSKSVLK